MYLLPNLKCNSVYRMGDVLFRQGYRWLRDRRDILNESKYAKSILFEYLSSISYPLIDPFENPSDTQPRGVEDLRLLKKICDQRDCKVDNDVIYAHIRCGDVVSLPIQRKMNFNLFNIEEFILKIRSLAEDTGINKIHLISKMHFGCYNTRNLFSYSEELVNENQILFSQILEGLSSFNVSIPAIYKDNIQSIDYDFLTLYKSKHLMLDHGGFSNLIFFLKSLEK